MNNKKRFNFAVRIIVVLWFSSASSALVLDDNGQISATEVSHVIHVKSESDIKEAIHKANNQHLSIAIMGKRYSQGGHTLSPHAIELDMLSFNKVLELNETKKQVTVQSGITWSDLQHIINPHNLAIRSMQSPNLFTVGGSMSVNAHGDDFRAGAVGNSIVSFHILLANGKKVLVTPESEPALWLAVRGGYGLLGVVTDLTLQLTDNNLLKSSYDETETEGFPIYFRDKILTNNNISLFYSHLNIVPGDSFLKKMYVITYTDTHQLPKTIIPLENPDKWNSLLTPLFNLSRHSNWGKAWRWAMEKHLFSKFYSNRVVSRNNAMVKPVRFASDHHSEQNADWLQEYFIPVAELPHFIHKLRTIILKNGVDLLNVTIRYVPAEENILLSYAKKNSFAVVLYFNQDLTSDEIKHTGSWTRNLVDTVLALGGNYYLPYQPFATKNQFRTGYDRYKQFVSIKQNYDSTGLFNNLFYQNYLS